MVLVDELDQHAMEAADKSKNEGIIIMPTTVSDPPEAGGVKAAPGTNKQRLRQIANTVAGRVIERTSVGRSTPIQTNLITNKEINSGCTMLRAPKELEMDRARPL